MLNHLGFIDLVIEVFFFEDSFDGFERIICIIDGEGSGKANFFSFDPQNPAENGVKSPHHDAFGFRAHQPEDSLLHFAGSLVGEGEREQLLRISQPLAQDKRQPVGEYPCFSGPSSRNDHLWSLHIHYRSLLGLVQFL